MDTSVDGHSLGLARAVTKLVPRHQAVCNEGPGVFLVVSDWPGDAAPRSEAAWSEPR